MALEIVIPDSGPLMSLGRINRLDLLDRFACPILITDMVADEVLRGMPGAPDAVVFKDWFEHRGNQIQTVETSIGILWKAVPPEQKEVLRRIKDAGGTSIWQFANTLERTMSPSDEALLLFEDSAVKKINFGPKVTKVTTWSFFLGLERMGVIASADGLIAEIADQKRVIVRDPFESRAPESDLTTDWTESYRRRGF